MRRNTALVAMAFLVVSFQWSSGAQSTDMRAVDPQLLNNLEWRFIGPVRGGRTEAVVGDPRNPLVFYFGSAHGGVWKTTDAGTYWRNVSDGFFNTAPVGAIDVSRSNPAIVYVGTGESITRQDITPGDGVYKSVDGGLTWAHSGLEDTRHISKIRIHPTNPDIVYVAAVGDIFGSNPERGVYRTKDGGKTWQRVLYKSDRAGAVDLVMDSGNPSVLYASLDQLQRLPWDDVSGGPDSGLFKSTDGGDTWVDITRNPGLPSGVIGKIGLALSSSQPGRVWALVEAADGALFRSDDAGGTWQRINDRRDLRRWASSYMHVVADPQDPNTVYLPTYQLQKSTDGGKTFAVVPTEHGDHHALWIDPANSNRMIDGDDGGATITLNGGASWSTLHNQPTADLFSLAIDDRYPYWVYGAQNDSAHIAIPSRTTGAAIGWMDNEPLPGGEGGQTAVTPDGSVAYLADRTEIRRYERKTGQALNVSVWPDDEFTFAPKDVKYRFYYTIPILLSPHDPNILYAGGNRLFRTTNRGNSWDPISPDLTRNRQDKMQKVPGGPITSMWSSLYWVSVIQAVAESPLKKGELWVGTDDSTVQMTTNGGETWTNVSPPDLPEWTTITNIDISAHEPGTAYIAANRYRVSDRTPYLYKTTDYGHSWRRITTGIRKNDFTWVVREDPARAGLLYAGTETGAYFSLDGGDAWQSLQRNLPVVQVRNMLVKGNDVVVATHGRGFWVLDNVTTLRQLGPDMTAAPAHLFEIQPAYRYLPIQVLSPRRPAHVGILYANAGDSVAYEDRPLPNGGVTRVFLNAGANPQGGVTIDYALKTRAGEATLTVLDAKGQIVKQFSSRAEERSWMPAEAGMNRVIWDMRYPGAREIPPPKGFVSAEYPRAQAPVAVPGRYTARLVVDGNQYEGSFEIKKDPRLTATDDDLQAQFDLMLRIRGRLSEVTDAVDRLRKAREALNTRKRANADVRALTDAKKDLEAIESALTRLAGPSPNMLPPMALNNRLAALSSDVQQVDARPTQQMTAVFEELSGLVVAQIRKLDGVLQNQVQGLITADRGTR